MYSMRMPKSSSFIIYRRSGHKVLASNETPSEKKKSVPTRDDYHHPPVRASTVRVHGAGLGLIWPVSHRMLRSNEKYSSAWGPYFLESLYSLAVVRTSMTSKALRQGHSVANTGLHVAQASFGKVCTSCSFEHERDRNEITA